MKVERKNKHKGKTTTTTTQQNKNKTKTKTKQKQKTKTKIKYKKQKRRKKVSNKQNWYRLEFILPLQISSASQPGPFVSHSQLSDTPGFPVSLHWSRGDSHHHH